MTDIRLQNLGKTFHQKHGSKIDAVKNLDLKIRNGELTTIVGPSGCGKSTLLRLIAGLERPTNGKIYFDHRDVTSQTPEKREIAMVFQNYALYPHLTAYENLALGLELKKTPPQEIKNRIQTARELLQFDQTLLQKKPAELSGGQKQRIALGRAIIRRPKILLLDEPLSSLDAQLRNTMRIEIARIHQELRQTMIYVTHDQTEAMTLGQNTIIMLNGSVAQNGHPKEIYENPQNLFAASFLGTPATNEIKGVWKKNTVDTGEEIFATHLFTEKEMPVVVTLRPEKLAWTQTKDTPGTFPRCRLPATVVQTEDLGHEVLLHVTTKGGQKLILREKNNPEKKEGFVDYNPSDTQLFIAHAPEKNKSGQPEILTEDTYRRLCYRIQPHALRPNPVG
jgi:ABC-type sugar transport system ATPase subunit